MFTPVQPSSAPMASQAPVWNTAPTKQPFGGMPNQSYGGVITNQPYGNTGSAIPPAGPPAPISQFTPSMAPPQSMDPYGSQYGQQQPMTPAVPPPPPSSSSTSGSRPSSVGPHSRSKYILDPSVKSGPTYGSSGYGQNNMYGGVQQPQSFPSASGFPTQSMYTVII